MASAGYCRHSKSGDVKDFSEGCLITPTSGRIKIDILQYNAVRYLRILVHVRDFGVKDGVVEITPVTFFHETRHGADLEVIGSKGLKWFVSHQ